MDPYRRYAEDPISERVLLQQGYTRAQIGYILQQPPPASLPPRLYDSFRTLCILGYTPEQAQQILQEIARLFINYGNEWQFGECDSAPCSAWRAERIQIGNEMHPRFAKRIHLFEKTYDGNCGRYLGYVTLRPTIENRSEGFDYTTIANLAAPRFMLRPRYHLITCVGGPADGVLPFRCAPFCAPNEDTRNHASCLHAAVQQALLLKPTFHFKPISSQDMITLLWKCAHDNHELDPATGQLIQFSKIAQLKTDLEDALQVLKRSEVNANGIVEFFQCKDELATDAPPEKIIAQVKLKAQQCMRDYLANGIPLIVALQEDYRPNHPEHPGEITGHCILVFGMHVLHDPEDSNAWIDTRELPNRFVTHDFSRGPFAEWTTKDLLNKAWENKVVTEDGDGSGVSFLAVLPKGGEDRARAVREMAVGLIGSKVTTEFWTRYMRNIGVSAEKIASPPHASEEETTAPHPEHHEIRYLIRFLDKRQTIARYFTSGREGEEGMLPHEDLANLLCSKLTHLWSVEVHLPHEKQMGKYPAGESAPPSFFSGMCALMTAVIPIYNSNIKGTKKRILTRPMRRQGDMSWMSIRFRSINLHATNLFSEREEAVRMLSKGSVPEVSLITSWRNAPNTSSQPLWGMQQALREGVNLLDLYFLDHADIPWYAAQANLGVLSDDMKEPHAFAASLTPEQIERIADALRVALASWYDGKLVGRRPRFACIATYFPGVSALEEEPRRNAVKALRNTLYLAAELGVRCVEAVGGAEAPKPDYTGEEDPKAYCEKRREALIKSVHEVYFEDSENPLNSLNGPLPRLAMELEPGVSFLLKNLDAFQKLYEAVQTRKSKAAEYLYLNVDIAHAFIIGYDPKRLKDMDLDSRVAHIHLSDHGGDEALGGGYASDLQPNIFHYYEEFEVWLNFAMELTTNYPDGYSGTIAIEMEARQDFKEVLSAIQITRQWLRHVWESKQSNVDTEYAVVTQNPHSRQIITQEPGGSDEPESGIRLADSGSGASGAETQSDQPGNAALSEKKPLLFSPQGALLVIDIGNSTRELLRSQSLEDAMCRLCKIVHQKSGSVMSFTGDGFIALFERAHFKDEKTTARHALEAAYEVCQSVANIRGGAENPPISVTVRAALHWGTFHIPTSGQLRDQILGEDVVRVSRLCDWLGRIMEPAQRQKDRAALVAATGEFIQQDQENQNEWVEWGDEPCKGLDKNTLIYCRVASLSVISSYTAGVSESRL